MVENIIVLLPVVLQVVSYFGKGKFAMVMLFLTANAWLIAAIYFTVRGKELYAIIPLFLTIAHLFSFHGKKKQLSQPKIENENDTRI